jgi:hypothetical protein
VGDRPEEWAAAGFTVIAGVIGIGGTHIVCAGHDGGRGIRSAHLTDLDPGGDTGDIDGMALRPQDDRRPPDPASTTHPNRVVHLDHLVALTPDMDRTTAALVAAGLDHRRDRRFEVDGRARRQAFFRLGDVILELAGSDDAHDPGPARLWGLAFTVDDLDATASVLGDRLGRVKDAVQAGRRIATLRTEELGVSVPIALMSPHPGSAHPPGS